ncbi:MAG: type II secretion system F family protein [Candidatus Aenigmatarchaeota archaeon]
MDKKIILLFLANVGIAIILLLINFLIFQSIANIFFAINLIAGFILVFPLILVFYLKYKVKKEMEENFPVFLRDFVESIRSGLTIPQAFKSVSKNDYRSLNPYIKKMAAQLDWGIPVDEVLLRFSKATKSKIIGRIVSSVIESHRYGGNLANTFQALSETAVEIERLRAERRLYLQSQLITGYIIFFVFLAVIIGLEKFLVPSLTQTTGITGAGLTTQAQQEVLAKEYKIIFRNLVLLQGFFAGLTVGKMAEGAIIAGIKHSIFMIFVGGFVFTIFG